MSDHKQCKQKLLVRFELGFEKLEEGECWLWLKCRDKCGYGQIRVKNKIEGAHRVSYEVYVGNIPSGLHVLHKCDTPTCVNPSHLFLGTHKDNMLDRKKKGRGNPSCGENSYASKLTEEQVNLIRKIYICGNPKYGQRALSRKFNVSYTLINGIVNRKRWKHVS
jgi:hypothetical protein